MFELPLITDSLGEHTYKIVWTVLWALLSLVTISLLTFARAKPLSKCVFLSLFAHILLLGHAYMINLDRPAAPPGDDYVAVTLRDDPLDPKMEQPRDVPAWDRYVTEETVLPDEIDLDRQLIDNDSQQMQRNADTAPSLNIGVPSELTMADIRLPGDQPQQTRNIHERPTGAVAAEITMPKAERRDDATPSGPRANDVTRPDRNFGDDLQLHRPPSSDFPNELFQATPDVQRLSDATTEDPADAIRARDDITAATLNQTVPGVNSVDTPSPAPGQAMPEELASASSTPSGAEGEQPDTSSGADSTQGSEIPGPTQPSTPKKLANGKPLPDMYQLRLQVDRGAVAQRNGGNERTEAAVAAALRWLSANQEANGSWDADKHGAGRESRVFGHDRKGAGAQADTAVTALAVLAFMAAGNTHLEGEYRQNVQRGLEFLLRSQARDGNMAGEAKLFAQMYCHGMATLAITEAYAMTGDERLKWWVDRAIKYTLATQHSTDGGWRYRAGDEGDMSQFGWQVMALKTAEQAGLEIPDKTRDGMYTFLARCASGRHNGLASYRPREDVSETMTAESLCCRFFLGYRRDDPHMTEAANYLDARRPADGRANLYYWYYGTLAMRQTGGERWQRWNNDMQAQLLPRQRQDGRQTGSWDPGDTIWGGYGGRVYSTAMSALCLEAYYRFAAE